MNKLQDIAVKVIDPPQAGTLSGNADALLHEIATLLAALVEDGRTSAIDLKGLPLTPGDREFLREQLGDGEVHATVNALGPSEVRETGYRGVWWVTHRNADDEVAAEVIEVTPLPAILAGDAEETAEGLERLRSALAVAATIES